MKKDELQNSDFLQHVEPQRRQFLAKLLAGGAALPVISSIALAQPPQEGQGKGGFGGKGKGGLSGKGKGEFLGKGNGGFAGKGEGGLAGKGKGGFGTSNPDSAEFASSLMKEFDKDGDEALNLKELTEALKSVRERSEMAGAGGTGNGGFAGKGKGGAGGLAGKGNGAAGGLAGKRKEKGVGSTQSDGAVKPKRPGSE